MKSFLPLINAAVLAVLIITSYLLNIRQQRVVRLQEDTIAKQAIAIGVWRTRALSCENGEMASVKVRCCY